MRGRYSGRRAESVSRSRLARECESGSRLSRAEASRKLRGLRRFPLRRTMNYVDLTLLILAIGVVGFLYSSVGHAGASGYIAVMALAGIAPAIIRPTALVLNIFVATIGSFQFWRAGYLSWRLFWPFAVLSVPAAYLGGYWQLSGQCFPHSARSDPAFLGGAFDLSAERFASRRAALHPGGDRRRCRHRTSLRPDRNRRRYFSDPALARLPMGAHPAGRRRFGVVHPGQLDRRTRRLPDRKSRPPFADSGVGAGRDRRRFPRLVFWEPAFSASNHLPAPGDGSAHRRCQAISNPMRGLSGDAFVFNSTPA